MVCLTQEPDLVLAIGQKLQRIQFMNSQSLKHSERKLPLFLNLSPFCLGQYWRKGTWPLGGVLVFWEASLGSEVHLSNVSLIPHHLTSSWWGLLWQMNLKYFAAAFFEVFFCSFPTPLQTKLWTFLLTLSLVLTLNELQLNHWQFSSGHYPYYPY